MGEKFHSLLKTFDQNDYHGLKCLDLFTLLVNILIFLALLFPFLKNMKDFKLKKDIYIYIYIYIYIIIHVVFIQLVILIGSIVFIVVNFGF